MATLECNGSNEISLGEIVDFINNFGTGGILWAADEVVPVGHVKTENNIAYVCITTHTSITGDFPDGSPSQSTQINWVPVSGGGVPTHDYSFSSTNTAGATPPATPGGVHDSQYGTDGTTTGTPDELGAYYFSVAKPSIGKTAVVTVNGFVVPVDEYTVIDGYIQMDSAVSFNSSVQIKI